MEAFHSTLEETIFSDLIILVLDIDESQELIEKKNKICLETIEMLGASGIPVITALNKIDLMKSEEIEEKLAALKPVVKNPILLSAKCGKNLDDLNHEILKILENYIQASFSLPINSQPIHFIAGGHEKAHVIKEEYQNTSIEIDFEANPSIFDQIKRKVEKLNGKVQLSNP
jgi:50S ribosomal subunit-associated GTPase HflX